MKSKRAVSLKDGAETDTIARYFATITDTHKTAPPTNPKRNLSCQIIFDNSKITALSPERARVTYLMYRAAEFYKKR